MPLHFDTNEYQLRRDAVIDRMHKLGLNGLLIFKQESMYYLTGYDTFGFCFFQCLYLGADGRYFLLTRAPDWRQAMHTSDIEDIRIWVDGDGVNPMNDLAMGLRDYEAKGPLGCEYHAYGLSAGLGKMLDEKIATQWKLIDQSALVSELRVVKSDAEVAFVRKAASLADDAMDAAIATAGPNVFEGDVLAAMQGAIFKGGGDYPGNEFIIGSGNGSLLCRYFSGRRTIDTNDQLTLEYAGVYRHYHAALMQTFLVGEPHPEQVAMHSACSDAMEACLEKIKPGLPMGQVFDEHAKRLDDAGYRDHRMNACGYSLGAMFTPTWMDYPMFYTNNPYIMSVNNVFFIHIMVMNADTQRSMSIGQTVRVSETGVERLSRNSTTLICV